MDEPGVEEPAPEQPAAHAATTGDEDFDRRWAEAEEAIMRAQADARERAQRAMEAGGAAPAVSRRVDRTESARPRAAAEEGSTVSETGGVSSEGSTGAPAPAAPKRRFASFNAIRTRIATVIWMIAVFAALALAVGALCVALKVDFNNSALNGLASLCDVLDFGSFKTFAGEMKLDAFLSTLDKVKPNDYPVKTVLMSWGAAAVIWLVVGKILDKLIRP